MIETFEFGLRKFTDVIGREKLGAVVPNQCEVSYFNQIPIPDRETIWSQLALTFPDRAGNTTIEGLKTNHAIRRLRSQCHCAAVSRGLNERPRGFNPKTIGRRGFAQPVAGRSVSAQERRAAAVRVTRRPPATGSPRVSRTQH
jgi:hypothetical protein